MSYQTVYNIYDYCKNVTDKPECKKCAKALQELENIDDEADQLGIGFVKIHDEELAEEYNLGDLPRLVYYRHEIPIIYEGSWLTILFNIQHNTITKFDILTWLSQSYTPLGNKIMRNTYTYCNKIKIIELLLSGELSREEDVLEWLIANKSTGDEEDVIEDVTAKTLNTLIGNVDNLVVLFCKLFWNWINVIINLHLDI